MKRPTGFTVLTFIFGWLALAGIANGIIQFNETQSISTALLAFCYGFSALASAIGLWKFSPWVFKAVSSWAVVLVLLVLNMQFGASGMYATRLPVFAGFMVLSITLSGLLLFYIRRKLPKMI